MKRIYLLCAFAPTAISTSTKYFGQLDLAKKALLDKKNELRYRPGVNLIKESDIEFTFLFSWEEHYVSWKILEKELCE